MRIPFAYGVAALGLLFAPTAAAQQSAQPQAAGEGSGEQGSRAASPTTPPYASKLRNGIRLIAARDLEGARAALREAVELNASRPEAHYYLGAADRVAGNLGAALELFMEAAQRASDNGDAGYRARALAAVAQTFERKATQGTSESGDAGGEDAEQEGGSGEQEADGDITADQVADRHVDVGGLEKARNAWQKVLQFAEGSDLLNAAFIRSRMNRIDKVIEQERAYVEVRKRIAERRNKNAESEQEEE